MALDPSSTKQLRHKPGDLYVAQWNVVVGQILQNKDGTMEWNYKAMMQSFKYVNVTPCIIIANVTFEWKLSTRWPRTGKLRNLVYALHPTSIGWDHHTNYLDVILELKKNE